MSKLLAAIACNLDANILQAALPLFESERVQAIEWSFDALFQVRDIPAWFIELLGEFSRADRLVGHGVFFSLFAGKWSAAQQDWLVQLKKLSVQFQFDHITEHFGFMTGADFHAGAPLSLPFTPATLAIGRDRLARIQEACQCPVGLENLAFSYALDDVKRQGEFLAQLIAPVNGFIILDLHNLYCQLHNFDLAFDELIGLYPLERVREIHISGGSWEDSPLLANKRIRRDTHDDAVPSAVFDLLNRTIPCCPNLKYVVLEQLGTGLDSVASRERFQEDFHSMDALVERHNAVVPFAPRQGFQPPGKPLFGPPIEDLRLHAQQRQLSEILENARDYADAQHRLNISDLAHSAWGVEAWAPHMVETALRVAQKWKQRSDE